MRPLFFVFLLLAASCGPSATLYTDSVFRAAMPEISAAWSGLAPTHDARVIELPREASKELRKTLSSQRTALIGVFLTQAERASLVADFPRVRLVFFVPAPDAQGEADIAIDRDAAWAVVAERAAVSSKPATALFPTDTSPQELDSFSRVWSQAGGGQLTTLVWPVAELPGIDPLFQWAGIPAEGLVKGLAEGRIVHTDPGMAAPPLSHGLTWKIRRQGLGEFLWKAASDSAKISYFLPLEAVPIDSP